MIRGGSWNNNAANCTATNRNSNEPDNRNNNLGCRLLAAPPVMRKRPLTEPTVFRSRTCGQKTSRDRTTLVA